MVAAELAPWVAETDAAAAVAALAKSVRQLGHDVTVAVPRYPGFEAGGLLVARRLTPLPLPGGGEVTVFDGQLPSGVGLVLFDAPLLFDRPGVYGEGGEDYPDNAKRFGVLGRAAAAYVRQRAQQGQAFDVLHLFDWPAALVPLALASSPGATVPSVLTLHDVRRKAIFPAKELESLGISREIASAGHDKPGSRIDVLALGVAHADTLTAPSPAYAAEMLDESRSGTLAAALAAAGKPVIGVLEGVDYAIHNPATDPLLASRYDAEDASNRGRSRTAVLRELGLPLDSALPLVAAIAEPGHDHGFDLVAAALPAMLKNELVLIVAGRGAAGLDGKLASARDRHADRFAVVETPDQAFSHRLLAAADLMILPARHDASGRRAMIAQRYGAVPVAHAVGAVRDVVVDCDTELETGTGFLFDDASSKALVGALARGLSAFGSPGWAKLRRRVMRLDVGWDRPARRYLSIYRQTLGATAA